MIAQVSKMLIIDPLVRTEVKNRVMRMNVTTFQNRTLTRTVRLG